MSPPPNRRDDEVRRLLDTPHPVVPLDLAARAVTRGRRIVRRRRIAQLTLWVLLFAAVVAGVVLAVMFWPDTSAPSTTTPTDGSWWSATGPVRRIMGGQAGAWWARAQGTWPSS